MHEARTSALLLEANRIFFPLFISAPNPGRENPMGLTRTLDTWVFSCSLPVRVHATEAVLVLAFDRGVQRGAGALPARLP